MAIILENAVMALGGEARNEARINNNIRTTNSHGNFFLFFFAGRRRRDGDSDTIQSTGRA